MPQNTMYHKDSEGCRVKLLRERHNGDVFPRRLSAAAGRQKVLSHVESQQEMP